MIDTPRITQTAAQLTASLHLVVPRPDIRNVMGPGLSEVRAAIAAHDIVAAGPWFTHHLRVDPDVFDFEICIPVATPFTTTGRVEAGRWPATTVARTYFHGDYDGLAAAWSEFDGWVADKGYMARPDLWERYVIGPESGSDSSTWRTELNRPLVD